MAPEVERGEEWVVVGRIRRPWGPRGEIIIDVQSDAPGRFTPGETLFTNGQPLTIERARPSKGAMILKLEGIDSQEAAGVLKGHTLTVSPASLPPPPEDTYYHYHLIGMEVYTRKGRLLGTLTEILSTGSNDVYVIKGEGKELLLPALADVILEVDVDKGRMMVELMPELES